MKSAFSEHSRRPLRRYAQGFLQYTVIVVCGLLAGCGGGGSGGGGGAAALPAAPAPAVALTVAAAPNVVPVVLDGGPAGAIAIINTPYVDVTVCRPGTTICQTIDHVLVDTGSYGFRIIGPGVLDPSIALPAVTNGVSNNPVGECAQFFSGYVWGTVRRADVKIGGETAPSIPIHQIESLFGVPTSCGNVGANIGSVAALGAKGILGIGLLNQDCGTPCAQQPVVGTYYECSGAACTSTAMPLANQVANPIRAFSVNNNGVAVVMPAVPFGGASTVTGALIFGIDTQTNNRTGTAAVYAANSLGNFTTTYKGAVLTSSFLDTGSNGLFFADRSIPACAISPGFYCPAATLSLSAVNSSFNGAVSGTINFAVENVEARNASVGALAAGGSLARGPGRNAFDWGMPFFFGRTVFVAIEGANTQRGVGPYWAY